MRRPLLPAWRSLPSALVLLTLTVTPELSLAGDPRPQPVRSATESFGVFVMLVENTGGSFDEAVSAVRRSIATSDMRLLTAYEAGVERDDCDHRATVFVIHDPAYASQILERGPRAAFALPLRLVVFGDETGTHIAAANPQSLNRTIVAETGLEEISAAAVRKLGSMLEAEFPGKVLPQQYGQMRDRGLIGKTMGLIAGGPFKDKIETAASVKLDRASVSEVADKLYTGFARLADQWKWRIRPVYKLDLSGPSVAIVGVTGAPMEAKAFQIMGAGGDADRKDYACPGIDHAAAFPIELVIVREGDEAKVLLIDEMFRMKMYFEDAGKMKFAMNMAMPGSIEDEIRDKIDRSLH